MSFEPKKEPTGFFPQSMPVLEASHKKHLEMELQAISRSINTMVEATKEIQEYLKTLP